MNRKQYFAMGWFFFLLMFFLMWFQGKFFYPGIEYPYQYIKSAIVSNIILLCFPLFILFQVLGWLEPKKLTEFEKDCEKLSRYNRMKEIKKIVESEKKK